MTTEELNEIKTAAGRIHAAAERRGLWKDGPSWETKMMNVVVSVAGAVVAERRPTKRHADLKDYDLFMGEHRRGIGDGSHYSEDEIYKRTVLHTVEDNFACAVIDIIDILAGFDKWRECKPYDWEAPAKLLDGDGAVCSLPELCYYLTEMTLNPFQMAGGLLNALNALKWWCGHKSIDLRRHVGLRMGYDETL